jgi:hypothetical protein
MSKDPKEIVREMVGLVGKIRTERLLIKADVAPSTAGKLARGKYESEVGEMVAAKIASARAAAEELANAG